MSVDKGFTLGQVGAKIGLDAKECVDETEVVLDLSTAASVSMIFRKPSGAEVTVLAVFADFPRNGVAAAGDGTDGRMMYVTPADTFLDEEGTWAKRLSVTGPGVLEYKTDWEYFEVSE